MPHPYFVHQRSLKSWAWWRKEMGAEERCRKTTGKSKISLGWDQPGLPLLRACRMILQHLLNVEDGCLQTVPGAGTSWGHPWHQKTCSLPATHILQHQAVRSLCHDLCATSCAGPCWGSCSSCLCNPGITTSVADTLGGFYLSLKFSLLAPGL